MLWEEILCKIPFDIIATFVDSQFSQEWLIQFLRFQQPSVECVHEIGDSLVDCTWTAKSKNDVKSQAQGLPTKYSRIQHLPELVCVKNNCYGKSQAITVVDFAEDLVAKLLHRTK